MTNLKSAAELCIDPAKHFDSPTDVLVDQSLSTDDKRRILLAWKADAQQLAVATDENMGGGEKPRLDAVNNALLNLPPVPEENPRN